MGITSGDHSAESIPQSQNAEGADALLLGADSETAPEISIVVPTLNEEEGVEECLSSIKRALGELEMAGEIIVSDSSSDKTPEIARELGAIVVKPDQSGYGYAYRYGFKRARGKYIAIGDADTTYDFEDLPRLFREIERKDADMVIGSRLNGEIKPGAMPPLHQYIGNPLLTKFLNVFYGSNISDAHSGFRLLTKEGLEQLDLQSDGMEFASEMLVEAVTKDLNIAEVPITYYPRKGEATLESFSDGWRHIRFMLINSPPNFFLAPGIFNVVVGLLVMGLTVTDVHIGRITLGVHSMVAGCLLTIIGVQVAILGLFSDLVSPLKKEPQSVITRVATSYFKLKHGAVFGIALFTLGTVYGVYLAYGAFTTGFTVIPLLIRDLVAFTAIIVGIQLIFNSVFFEMLIHNFHS